MAYIKLEDAINHIKNHTPVSCSADFFEGQMDCIGQLKSLPIADVVEVVRCKDCKHSREQDRVFGITDYKCSKHNISCLSPYDFCSYGERRDA